MMIPQQREMVAKLANKPFALVGINSDRESRSALKERLENEKITWPQFVEGGERSISTQWNVNGYPTIFILDEQGVIRHRGYMGEEQIEKAVEELLAKLAPAKQP